MGFVDGLDPDNPAAFDYASGAGTLAPTFPTAAPDAPGADNRDVGATSSKKTGELRRLQPHQDVSMVRLPASDASFQNSGEGNRFCSTRRR